MRRLTLLLVPGLCLLFGGITMTLSGTGVAGDVHPEFQRTWERTDRPVSTGETSRTWMWGPGGHTDAFQEPYLDADGGYRLVQYFDKSRMEVTDPTGDPDDLWYVTNGLLARELITGEMQLGDSTFDQHSPADVQIAGDEHPDSPSYASFQSVLSAPPGQPGDPITEIINQYGTVNQDHDLTGYGVTNEEYVEATDKTVASVFWAFMNSSGLVYGDGQTGIAPLFEDPYFGVGLPITGAYWMNVPVGGAWQDVLAQCFERRCLTYTPSNPDGWRVEAGNIGQHYYAWRYESDSGEPDTSVDPPITAIPSDDELGPPVPGRCAAEKQAVLKSVSDDLGNTNPNSWASGTSGDWPGGIESAPGVSIGEQRTFSFAATGDCGELEFRVQKYGSEGNVGILRNWSDEAGFAYTFTDEDAGTVMFIVDVRNQDPRRHFDDRDDYTYLTYLVE